MAIHANSTTVPASHRGLLRLVPKLALEAGVPKSGDTPEPLLPAEPDTAAQARALHSRRELHQALDYGFALLDALDLSPLALDIIDGAIARLDAMDAPGEDLEDDGLAEEEPDAEDDDPAEETSLETAGRGFVRCGADDDEDGFDIEEQHDAEQTYEDGSDDGRSDAGWFLGELDVPLVLRGMMEDARRQSAVFTERRA